jgi:hypothetical protein
MSTPQIREKLCPWTHSYSTEEFLKPKSKIAKGFGIDSIMIDYDL